MVSLIEIGKGIGGNASVASEDLRDAQHRIANED